VILSTTLAVFLVVYDPFDIAQQSSLEIVETGTDGMAFSVLLVSIFHHGYRVIEGLGIYAIIDQFVLLA
jgi:hypothetical protein